MSDRRGLVFKGVLVIGTTAVILGTLALSFFAEPAAPLSKPTAQEEAPLSLFAAPSHIPPGEQWVLIGSFKDLPQDLIASPVGAGVSVLELQRLSIRAVGVRLQVTAGVPGKLIRLSSVSANSEAYPDLYQGQPPESLSSDTNLSPEHFVDGQLFLEGQYFMYGYLPGSQAPLAAVRIHNRSTGVWHRHELAEVRAMKAREEPLPLGPGFEEVDVLQTLPDTDGDGVPDFAEEPEEPSPTPDHLGVELAAGANMLDLVATDEAGNASWRTINVFTSYVPHEGF